MTVSPLPRDGLVLAARDRVGRSVRIARHPDASRIVLSIWQGTTCQATVRLAPEDVATLVGALTGMLVPPSAEPHRQAG